MGKSHKINNIRSEIDTIDLKILELISDRKELVTKIVEFKDRDQIIDQERINKILERLDNEAKKRGIPQDLVRNLWKSMIKSFIEYEEEIFDESQKKKIR